MFDWSELKQVQSEIPREALKRIESSYCLVSPLIRRTTRKERETKGSGNSPFRLALSAGARRRRICPSSPSDYRPCQTSRHGEREGKDARLAGYVSWTLARRVAGHSASQAGLRRAWTPFRIGTVVAVESQRGRCPMRWSDVARNGDWSDRDDRRAHQYF